MRRIAALAIAAFLGACAGTPDPVDVARQVQPRTTWIVGGDGRALGQATFTEAPTGVLIRLEFSQGALPPGWHGLHLHERGDCSDFAAGFQASGGHVGMNRRIQHGLLNRRGPEAGDLPNIFASPGGPFGAEVFSPYVTLYRERIGNRMPLLDSDGAALMIHASPDDQTSQPIGGAGARVACAALTVLP
ncbi:MAG: superoxide dismutase family protein [Hyphomonadaceae bacterium]